MVRFITIRKFCELTGRTPASVYTRKCKGVWLEGTVWRYAPGSKTILMDLQEYDNWVLGPTPSAWQRAGGKRPLRPTLDAPPKASGKSPTLPKLDR